MGLRRGFKTEATGLAKEIRGELGLGPFNRLDPAQARSTPRDPRPGSQRTRRVRPRRCQLLSLNRARGLLGRYGLQSPPQGRGTQRFPLRAAPEQQPDTRTGPRSPTPRAYPRARRDDRMSELRLHQRGRSKLARRCTARHRRNGPRRGPRTVHTKGCGTSARGKPPNADMALEQDRCPQESRTSAGNTTSGLTPQRPVYHLPPARPTHAPNFRRPTPDPSPPRPPSIRGNDGPGHTQR